MELCLTIPDGSSKGGPTERLLSVFILLSETIVEIYVHKVLQGGTVGPTPIFTKIVHSLSV